MARGALTKLVARAIDLTPIGRIGVIKMRRLAAIVILAIMAEQAIAQSVTDKNCILEAATQLPLIQGLAIKSSVSRPADRLKIAAEFAKRPQSSELAIALADRFSVLGFDEEEQLRRAIDATAREALLSKIIAAALSEAREIEFEVSAAGQTVSMGSICGVSTTGSIIAAARGVIR